MKDRSNKGFAVKLKHVIGIVLIAFGIISLTLKLFWTFYYSDQFDNSMIFLFVAYGITIVGGIVIYLMKRFDTKIVIGLTGIIIASSDIVSTGMLLSMVFDVHSISDLVIILMGVAVPFADLFLIVFSIRYMLGHKRNAMRMAICVFIPMFINLFMVFMVIAMFRANIESMLSSLSNLLPNAIIYGIYFWFLLLPGVREDLSSWKVYKLTRDVYRAEIVDPKSTIFRGDLISMKDNLANNDAWGESKNVPGAKEFCVNFGKDMNIRRMTFRKMDGDDNIRVSIIPEKAKEYIQATRFDLTEIVPIGGGYENCPVVRIFGKDGYFIDIAVRDDRPKPRKEYAIDRLIDRMKMTKFNKNKD